MFFMRYFFMSKAVGRLLGSKSDIELQSSPPLRSGFCYLCARLDRPMCLTGQVELVDFVICGKKMQVTCLTNMPLLA